MTDFLTFCSLGKCYGRVAALREVDLCVERGSVLAVLGPNGAGKSTLFGCLLGFVRPSAGTILHSAGAVDAQFRRSIGYMPERVSLYPHCSVRENAMFFARLKAQPASELERQLKRVGLYDVQDRAVRQLSKGMLQRLGLAIALCGAPDLLVLDEPFNGLDPALLDGLQAILCEEHERGATMLISTHTMSAVEPIASHVAVLLNGELVAHASIGDLHKRFGCEPLEAIYHAIARRQRRSGLEEVFA